LRKASRRSCTPSFDRPQTHRHQTEADRPTRKPMRLSSSCAGKSSYISLQSREWRLGHLPHHRGTCRAGVLVTAVVSFAGPSGRLTPCAAPKQFYIAIKIKSRPVVVSGSSPSGGGPRQFLSPHLEHDRRRSRHHVR
jgi:hypothetical protein